MSTEIRTENGDPDIGSGAAHIRLEAFAFIYLRRSCARRKVHELLGPQDVGFAWIEGKRVVPALLPYFRSPIRMRFIVRHSFRSSARASRRTNGRWHTAGGASTPRSFGRPDRRTHRGDPSGVARCVHDHPSPNSAQIVTSPNRSNASCVLRPSRAGRQSSSRLHGSMAGRDRRLKGLMRLPERRRSGSHGASVPRSEVRSHQPRRQRGLLVATH
jgi:hypothetical protein